jgi:cyclopropane fatty-acyl-phospholipid synthase-like methyltransferase
MAPTNYDEVAAGFDQRYVRAPYAAVEQVLRAFMQEPERRVLEVGCDAAGLAAIESAAEAESSRGATLMLHARLHLFATTGRVSES